VVLVGVPRKVREMSENFTLPGEWSPCILLTTLDGLKRSKSILGDDVPHGQYLVDMQILLNTG